MSITLPVRFLAILRRPLKSSVHGSASPKSASGQGPSAAGLTLATPSCPSGDDPEHSQPGGPLLGAFAAAMFASAALLFWVEPMFAKMALPLLGGSAAVWTTCLAFFQAALLAGYAYAHLATRWLPRRAQMALHGAVLLVAVAFLPIHLRSGWVPPVDGSPVWWLLGLLLVTVGFPFFVLAATTPILQEWFSHSEHPSSQDPYFLYAASNAGSLVGLLSYPFVLEPFLRLHAQAVLWACGYGGFVLLAGACMRAVGSSPDAAPPPGTRSAPQLEENRLGLRPDSQPSLAWRLKIVALTFVPSSLVLGVTTSLTTDIPAIPLFWVLPLSLYLLSFVIVFARKPLLSHLGLNRRLPLLILAAAIPYILKGSLPLIGLLLVNLLALFAVAIVCHGEVAIRRPSTRSLTEFYLWISVGGVLGGIFNALVVPRIFTTVAELPLALVLAAFLRPSTDSGEESPRERWLDYIWPTLLGLAVAAAILGLQSRSVMPERYFNLVVFGPAAVICLRFSRPRRFGAAVAALLLASLVYVGPYGHILHSERSFYGVYRVGDDVEKGYRVLYHGGTAHGVQSHDPKLACEPLAYYTRTGPIGQVFGAFRTSPVENEVAVVGLGAGVMAAYQQPGQRFTFFEIDPLMLRIAQNPAYFTYLRDCGPTARVVLGDARLSLQKAGDGAYGIIVLDAFSGDSIPTHLLTREAVALYLRKLEPHGLLAFHISNRYLELHGVLGNLARDAGLVCLANDDVYVSAVEARQGKFASWWVVMARSAGDLAALQSDGRWSVLEADPGAPVWTDDFSNIVSILRFR